MLVGMGNSLGIRNPHGQGLDKILYPSWVWFFSGHIFLREYGFGQVIPIEFLPSAISTDAT
jgi:hypothetical protein